MPKIEGGMRQRLRAMWAAATRGPWALLTGFVELALLAILIMGGLYLSGVIDYDFTKAPDERATPEAGATSNTTSRAQASEAAVGPTVENPTSVGQALDAIARPAIAEVYGDAQLQWASPTEALIVNLVYGIPEYPAEGDAERLRDAFESRGARIDPANDEIDNHAGEEFIMLMDTGNPAFKTVRVSVSGVSKGVYVNADRVD